ncbi:MAG: NAD(+)/NADH kinase [bacterium]|nr:NAD(+)/NADH kinase [bacterium]
MKKRNMTIGFFARPDNIKARLWEAKIRRFLAKKYSWVRIVEKKPRVLIVLGGDGTILEAARKYQNGGPVILGLNLGRVGFLASCRNPKKFLGSIDAVLKGKHRIAKRMMLASHVIRRGKTIFSASSLNDVAIQNPLGIVELEVSIEGHAFQYVRGTGLLVSTATGSTAYNLSAHGPIVMPDIKCFIITELLDHNIPTPSIVVKRNREIVLKILDFRTRGLLSITKTGERADVLLVSDSDLVCALKKGDTVIVSRSPRLVKFAEIEKGYFFKSLQEKFAFR